MPLLGSCLLCQSVFEAGPPTGRWGEDVGRGDPGRAQLLGDDPQDRPVHPGVRVPAADVDRVVPVVRQRRRPTIRQGGGVLIVVVEVDVTLVDPLALRLGVLTPVPADPVQPHENW